MTTSSSPRTAPAKKKLPATVVPSVLGGRVMSVNQLADQLDRDRATIMRWIKAGCPVIQTADKSAGLDWKLNIADVVKWREQQIASEAVHRAAEDGESYDDPKDLVSLARMQMKMEEERKQLVKLAWAIMVLQRCLGLVRQSVMALPLRFLDLLPGIDGDEHARIFNASTDLCVDALEDAKETIREFVEEASHPTERAANLNSLGEKAKHVSPAS